MCRNILNVWIGVWCVIIAASSTVYGQDRVNRPQLQLQKVAELSKAKGWMLSPEGQWESGNNKIPWRLTENLSVLKGVPKYALGTDNFKNYRFYRATIAGHDFMVFVKNYTSGTYAYQSIQEGWFDGGHTQAYALSFTELSKLKDLQDGKINRVVLSAFDYESINMEDVSEALNIIKKSLGPQNEELTPASLHFEIAPYREKNILQFNIWNEVHYDSMKSKTGTRNNPYIDGDLVYGSKNLFKYCYYEAPYKQFLAFIDNTVAQAK